MPPGLGDATLDAVRLIPRAEFVVVATASRVVAETVARTLRFLTALQVKILGVVENMRRGNTQRVCELADTHRVPFLGCLPFDDTLEDAVGDVARLAKTSFAAALRNVFVLDIDAGL